MLSSSRTLTKASFQHLQLFLRAQPQALYAALRARLLPSLFFERARVRIRARVTLRMRARVTLLGPRRDAPALLVAQRVRHRQRADGRRNAVVGTQRARLDPRP